MSARYDGPGQHFAFSVGGEFNLGKVEKPHLLALAESLGIAPKYLLKIASETIARVLAAVPLAVAEVLPLQGGIMGSIAEHVTQFYQLLSLLEGLPGQGAQLSDLPRKKGGLKNANAFSSRFDLSWLKKI